MTSANSVKPISLASTICHSYGLDHAPLGRLRGLSTESYESGGPTWSTISCVAWPSSSVLKNTSSCSRISISYPASCVKKLFTAEACNSSTYRSTTVSIKDAARARKLYAAFPNIISPVSACRVRNARTIAGSGRKCRRRCSGLYATRR